MIAAYLKRITDPNLFLTKHINLRPKFSTKRDLLILQIIFIQLVLDFMKRQATSLANW